MTIGIKSGEAIIKMHHENADTFFADEPESAPATGSDPLFLGYIVYEDGIGTKRTTAFCRTYVRRAKRFLPIDDKDYEYQD